MAYAIRAFLLTGLLTVSGCGHNQSEAAAAASEPSPSAPDWRAVATSHDRDRLRHWRDAWMQALVQARAADPKAIADQSDLFAPDRALVQPLPPPGDYRCRTYKLGATSAGLNGFVSYPAYPCRIAKEGNVLSLTRYGGSQRPVGLIFNDLPTRAVFLGTLMLGQENQALDYGRDQYRDMAGFVERIGDSRWRLALPYPATESKLDIIEITPASPS